MDITELNTELEKRNLSAFWRFRTPLHIDEAPYIWKWKDVYECLMIAKDVVGLELAERRSIRLVNPHAPGTATSRTLLLTFSIVNPGEVAKTHRHNLAAIRFVVKAKDGVYTNVEGERFPMQEGDLILTPNWTWHDHFNGSDEPVVWLDGLDGPLIRFLNVLFYEQYEADVQQFTREIGDSTRRLGFARATTAMNGNERLGVPFHYKFHETYEALKAVERSQIDPYDGAIVRYINPATGGYTLPTMSCEIQLLKPRFISQKHRHTSTALYHVLKGRGRTTVGEGRLEWSKGDSFAIPLWQWHHHENIGEEEAIIFSINDRPIMEAFQLYKEETNAC
jgi:gentisate 1,2-dioxygenase